MAHAEPLSEIARIQAQADAIGLTLVPHRYLEQEGDRRAASLACVERVDGSDAQVGHVGFAHAAQSPAVAGCGA